jgi:hypothetical protein
VIKDGAADNAAADYNGLCMGTHVGNALEIVFVTSNLRGLNWRWLP